MIQQSNPVTLYSASKGMTAHFIYAAWTMVDRVNLTIQFEHGRKRLHHPSELEINGLHQYPELELNRLHQSP